MNQSDWEANMATYAKRGKIKWNHDWFWFWSVELHEKTGKRVGFSPHESSLKPLLDLIPVWNTALNVKTRDTSFYYFITTTTTTIKWNQLPYLRLVVRRELSGKNYWAMKVFCDYRSTIFFWFFFFFSQESLLWLVIQSGFPYNVSGMLDPRGMV